MRRKRSLHWLFATIGFLFLVSTAFDARAQAPADSSAKPVASPTPSLEREFFKNLLRDQKAIWTAPFHLQQKDAKWLLPSTIGTMALLTTDRITGDEMAEFDRQIKPSRIVSYGGSTYGVGTLAATFYLVGRKNNNARARETGLLSAEAAINGLIVSNALKAITQRARPHAGRDRSEFFDGGSSFPSGHSIQAWSVAAVVADEYHDRRMVQVAAYGVASAVSLARFTGEKHYLSDVVVGSMLGYGIGQYVYHAHHRENSFTSDAHEVEKSKWPAILPRYNRGARQYGVGLTWNL